MSVDCPLSPNTDQLEMTDSDEALTTRDCQSTGISSDLKDQDQIQRQNEVQHLKTSAETAAQTNLSSQLMLSPDRELLRAVTETSTIQRDYPLMSVDCPLSPNTDRLEMTKSVEALEAHNQWVQVIIRNGKDTDRFEVIDEADFWKKLEERWGIQEDQYR
jgi:hypothetical protein